MCAFAVFGTFLTASNANAAAHVWPFVDGETTIATAPVAGEAGAKELLYSIAGGHPTSNHVVIVNQNNGIRFESYAHYQGPVINNLPTGTYKIFIFHYSYALPQLRPITEDDLFDPRVYPWGSTDVFSIVNPAGSPNVTDFQYRSEYSADANGCNGDWVGEYANKDTFADRVRGLTSTIYRNFETSDTPKAFKTHTGIVSKFANAHGDTYFSRDECYAYIPKGTKVSVDYMMEMSDIFTTTQDQLVEPDVATNLGFNTTPLTNGVVLSMNETVYNMDRFFKWCDKPVTFTFNQSQQSITAISNVVANCKVGVAYYLKQGNGHSSVKFTKLINVEVGPNTVNTPDTPPVTDTPPPVTYDPPDWQPPITNNIPYVPSSLVLKVVSASRNRLVVNVSESSKIIVQVKGNVVANQTISKKGKYVLRWKKKLKKGNKVKVTISKAGQSETVTKKIK